MALSKSDVSELLDALRAADGLGGGPPMKPDGGSTGLRILEVQPSAPPPSVPGSRACDTAVCPSRLRRPPTRQEIVGASLLRTFFMRSHRSLMDSRRDSHLALRGCTC